jgi:hypothetical protein
MPAADMMHSKRRKFGGEFLFLIQSQENVELDRTRRAQTRNIRIASPDRF